MITTYLIWFARPVANLRVRFLKSIYKLHDTCIQYKVVVIKSKTWSESSQCTDSKWRIRQKSMISWLFLVFFCIVSSGAFGIGWGGILIHQWRREGRLTHYGPPYPNPILLNTYMLVSERWTQWGTENIRGAKEFGWLLCRSSLPSG